MNGVAVRNLLTQMGSAIVTGSLNIPTVFPDAVQPVGFNGCVTLTNNTTFGGGNPTGNGTVSESGSNGGTPTNTTVIADANNEFTNFTGSVTLNWTRGNPVQIGNQCRWTFDVTCTYNISFMGDQQYTFSGTVQNSGFATCTASAGIGMVHQGLGTGTSSATVFQSNVSENYPPCAGKTVEVNFANFTGTGTLDSSGCVTIPGPQIGDVICGFTLEVDTEIEICQNPTGSANEFSFDLISVGVPPQTVPPTAGPTQVSASNQQPTGVPENYTIDFNIFNSFTGNTLCTSQPLSIITL